MKERPILFYGPMVRAILEGRKFQTRRLVSGRALELINFFADEDNNERPGFLNGGADGHDGPGVYVYSENYPDEGSSRLPCPFGQPDDRLWVRETFVYRHKHDRYYYRADHPKYDPYAHNGWKPSIFMPRVASRITLEVTGVRVERLQDISESAARAEGVQRVKGDLFGVEGAVEFCHHYAVDAFAALWRSINGDDSWQANPWVWVVEFKRVSP